MGGTRGACGLDDDDDEEREGEREEEEERLEEGAAETAKVCCRRGRLHRRYSATSAHKDSLAAANASGSHWRNQSWTMSAVKSDGS